MMIKILFTGFKMKKRTLRHTDIQVSPLCMGTMTFGEQNTLAESHQIMDCAYDYGINFFDTAEMYPIPPNAQTHFRTEEFIGQWDKFKNHRDQIILATKIIGPSSVMTYIRGGSKKIKDNIQDAITGSLRRLNTDYIDLYQIHWPARPTNFFGQLDYKFPTNLVDDQITETNFALESLKQEGLIRAYGISNETPWGMMKYQEVSKINSLTGISTIQNPYNLLNRSFEVGMAEICHREGIQLLPYSPLGFGVLTGKYIGQTANENSRLLRWPDYKRYSNENAVKATKKYMQLAQDHGLSLTQIALQFVTSRPFVLSNIIGATTIPQLKENLDSIQLNLKEEILRGIEQIHQEHPNPAP